MFEYPPILRGTEKQQLAALRDYLVRMARSLQAAQTAAESAGTAALSAADSAALSRLEAGSPAAGDSGGDWSDLRQARHAAGQLRALITKTARQMDGRLQAVQQHVERVDSSLREDYLAVSDFGEYTRQAELNMSATAEAVVESYAFSERIDAVGASLDALDSYLTDIHGEIRRGLITDPETGEQVLGIAVAEQLHFTGQTHTRDGLVYYELSPGQTLGLYTATGWQFWINGAKRGWFDSSDSMLHVTNIVSENSFKLSDKWELVNVNGFGIRYVGG